MELCLLPGCSWVVDLFPCASPPVPPLPSPRLMVCTRMVASPGAAPLSACGTVW